VAVLVLQLGVMQLMELLILVVVVVVLNELLLVLGVMAALVLSFSNTLTLKQSPTPAVA
jgi:hypothetical protein